MATKTETPLRLGEVCAIIEACGKAGVRTLRLGDLYLSLGEKPEQPEVLRGTSFQPMPDHAKQNAAALDHDEEEVRAEQLRMLMIENPMEYERQLRDGELGDEPTEPEDDAE